MWYCASRTFRGARADCRLQSVVTSQGQGQGQGDARPVHGIRMISQSCDNKAQQVP